MDKVHQRVEEKVKKLVETVSKKRTLDNHFVHDCVDDAVQIKLKEDREEANEIRMRSNIIHGLKAPDEMEDTEELDEVELTRLLHQIKCDDVSVHGMTRLGRRVESDSGKPRPIKVIVASEERKEKVLRQAKT